MGHRQTTELQDSKEKHAQDYLLGLTHFQCNLAFFVTLYMSNSLQDMWQLQHGGRSAQFIIMHGAVFLFYSFLRKALHPAVCFLCSGTVGLIVRVTHLCSSKRNFLPFCDGTCAILHQMLTTDTKEQVQFEIFHLS